MNVSAYMQLDSDIKQMEKNYNILYYIIMMINDLFDQKRIDISMFEMSKSDYDLI